jgi:polysaccharide export outer membrane protein
MEKETHMSNSFQRTRMVGVGLLVGAVGALALGACAGSTSAQARDAKPFQPQEYRIGVEDVLEIAVWREPELSTVAPVRPDGKVTVPVAGEVAAAGRTAHELEQELAKKFSVRIASPTVTVVIKEVNSSRVFVLGEVAKPGAYPMRGAMTVVQALAVAGGMTEFADKGSIVILRRGDAGAQQRLGVNFNDAVSGSAIELVPGDTVVVP